MYHQGHIPPIVPQSPYNRRDGRERYPIEPIQGEVQSPQNQTPSLQINVRFEKEAPNTPIIKPTLSSVRELANWYRANGISSKHIPISGARVGNTELPPLWSQAQDFDEEGFRVWADSVIGPSAITMSANQMNGDSWENIELDILRKVYGNLSVIEQTRALKEKKDIDKGTIHNLNKIRLDQKLQEVIDERYWEPLEFREDIQMINTMIRDEKENGNLSEEGIDYLFGAVLWAHTSRQNYKLTTVDNQPVVVTGDATLDAQWKSTLETLDFWSKTGVPFLAKDNRPKIADYIAAYTYHTVDKNLTGHFTTLSQQVIGASPDVTLTTQRIDKSNLTNEEKTFLTQWVGQESRLWDIVTRQRDYVERAMQNTRGKSSETLKRDIARAPLSTMMQISPMTGLAVGAAIIYGLMRLMGMNGGIAKFFWGTAAVLWGMAIVGNIGTIEDVWRQNFGENAGNMTTQAPTSMTDSGDVVTDTWRELTPKFQAWWERFASTFSGADDWSWLMLDDRIWPKITTQFPVGVMLHALGNDPNGEYKDYKWSPQQEKDFNKILKTLNGEEKADLNTMLTETWNRYTGSDFLSPITGASNNNNRSFDQLKKGTISDMIDSIDTDYGWISTILRPDYWSGNEDDRRRALIEFTKNPAEWWNMKIGDIMWLWHPGSVNLPSSWTIDPNTTALLEDTPLSEPESSLIIGRPSDNIVSLKQVVKQIWESKEAMDPNKTIRELLTKED